MLPINVTLTLYLFRFIYLLCFEKGFLHVTALAALELTEMYLPLPPKFWTFYKAIHFRKIVVLNLQLCSQVSKLQDDHHP